jgi:hypothetical protein
MIAPAIDNSAIVHALLRLRPTGIATRAVDIMAPFINTQSSRTRRRFQLLAVQPEYSIRLQRDEAFISFLRAEFVSAVWHACAV